MIKDPILQALNDIHESLEKANHLKQEELKIMADRNHMLEQLLNSNN